jgi:hypothetical protein
LVAVYKRLEAASSQLCRQGGELMRASVSPVLRRSRKESTCCWRITGGSRASATAAGGAIAEICGSDTFTAAQIADLAESDLSTRARLRIAVAGRSAKSLGKLLADHAGEVFAGLRLERIPANARGVCPFTV